MKREKVETKEKAISVNRFILPALFIFFSILLEITNFLYLGFRTSSGSVQLFPSAWLFNIGAILIIAGIMYLVSNKVAMLIIFYIFIFLQVGLNIVNANIYNVFGDVFTLDYIALGGEAAAAIRWEFIDFWSILLYLGIFAVIIATTVLLYKKNKRKIKLKVLANWTLALALVILCESCGVTLFILQREQLQQTQSESVEGNSNYLWDSFQFKIDAYQQFGFYGFYVKNIYNSIKGEETIDEAQKTQLIDYIEAGKTQKEELDCSLQDDNLIVVLCESHETFAYDPINTPNVWALMNGDACYFDSFYGHNKTNVSEGIVLAGNMTKENNLHSLVNKYGYDYAYTLPRLFKQAHGEENVIANYLHSYQGHFYTRDIDYTEKGYGFDGFYTMEDYKEQSEWFGDWISDYEFVDYFADQIVPKLKEGQRFISTYAIISTHGPYDYENPRFEQNYKLFDENFETYKQWFDENNDTLAIPEDKGEFEQFRRYKVAAMDFDNMIGRLFEELENKGRLEDTTVVLFSDHNCYYSNLGINVKGIEKTDYSNIEANHIPLIIYNSKLKAGRYDMFCNTYDIYPTICELHGLEYNRNLVQGYNIFSDRIKDSFFASHLGGMFTDKFFSKNIADVVPMEEEYTEEDIQHFKMLAERYYAIQIKLEDIYHYNLAKKEKEKSE